MNSMFRVRLFAAVALAATCFNGMQAFAQRAIQSPLVVTVTRDKTDSGRTTHFDDGYDSSKSYNRTVSLKINVRNMSTNEIPVKIQALFVAESQGYGGQDGIYCKRETEAKLTARESHDFSTESDALAGHVYKSTYSSYSYKSGSKFKGYIVRVFANDQLVEVNGSQPSLQKVGWDEKALKKMLPPDPEEERANRPGRIIRPAQPVQPVQPAQPAPNPGRGSSSF